METGTQKQEIVQLDVGGTPFKVLKTTLLRYPDSLLAKMLEEFPNLGSAEEPLFVDRSPQSFAWILEIYRGGDYMRCAPEMSEGFLQNELDFYQLEIPPANVKKLEAQRKCASDLPTALFDHTPPFKEIAEAIQKASLNRQLPVDVFIYIEILDKLVFTPKFYVRPGFRSDLVVGCSRKHRQTRRLFSVWRYFCKDVSEEEDERVELFVPSLGVDATDRQNMEAREFGLAIVEVRDEYCPGAIGGDRAGYLVVDRIR